MSLPESKIENFLHNVRIIGKLALNETEHNCGNLINCMSSKLKVIFELIVNNFVIYADYYSRGE